MGCILSNFPYSFEEDSNKLRDDLYSLGYFIGKWIYLIDALDDLKTDMNSNKFNPFNVLFNTNSLQFEDLIRDLQEKSIVANRDAREAKRLKEEAEALKKKYDEKLKKLDTVRDKVYDEARQEAKQIVSNAKDEADEMICECLIPIMHHLEDD